MQSIFKFVNTKIDNGHSESLSGLFCLPLKQGRSQDFTLGATEAISAEGAKIEALKAPRGMGIEAPPQQTRGSGGAS